MNKVKRSLQLSAAIIGILFSSLCILGSVYMVFISISLIGFLGGFEFILTGYLFFIAFVVLVFSVANIIVCSFLCRNKVSVGLSITAILLNALLIIGCVLATEYQWLAAVPIVVVILLFASMFVKNTPKSTSIEVTAQVPENIEKLENPDEKVKN